MAAPLAAERLAHASALFEEQQVQAAGAGLSSFAHLAAVAPRGRGGQLPAAGPKLTSKR